MGHRRPKTRGSIRDEVEKLSKRDHSYVNPCIDEETGPPPAVTDENNRLVVHWLNNGRRFNLCHKLSAMDWPTIILNYLQGENVAYSSTVQSCMWPALTKLQSVMCIAGPRQGKTIGWVLPLLATLLDKDLYEHLPAGGGPRAVVLCPGHVSAGKAGESLERVISGAGLDLKIVTASKGGQVDNVDLVNGCDVLVISPPRLVQLVRERITGLDRCCHLVMEDAHTNLQIHLQDIVRVLIEWRRKRTGNLSEVPDQVVVVGEEWSIDLQEFTEKFLSLRWNPTLVFGSMLEAAIYMQLPIATYYHQDYEEKLNSVLKILRTSSKMRTVITCSRYSVSLNISTLLSEQGVIPVVVKKGELDDIVDITASISVWLQSTSGVPLVVSDDLLLTIPSIPGCADCLIHWDIPSASKKIFSLRFLFVKDTLQHAHDHDLGAVNKADVHLLLCDKDKHSFATLVPLLTRCRADVPREVVNQVDNQKHGIGGLCDRMVEGRMDCSPLCGKRHWLDRVADQGQIEEKKLEGVVEFMVLRVETPVLYWVRVIDSVYDKDFQRRSLKMAMYFSRAGARVPMSTKELEKGVIVAVETEEEVYHRAKVLGLEFKECKEMDKLVSVKVFLIDVGITEEYYPDLICKLPQHLGLDIFAAGATAVTVTGILPPDKDPDWSLECAELVAGYLTPLHSIVREEVCRGRVLLHTSSMLWVDRCQLMVKQPTIGKFVLHFETYSWLVSQRWAVPNREHSQQLLKLASDGGLDIPKDQTRDSIDDIENDIDCSQSGLDITSPEDKYAQSPRTAYLPLSRMVPVVMSECVTPDTFYLQVVSHLPSLIKLEQEVNDWAIQNPLHLPTPVTGQLVLARVGEDTHYARAEVRYVGDMVVVYMVDIGEIATVLRENILPCPEFISHKIPHQAVQCSLDGIRPVSEKWVSDAGDKLFDMSRDLLTDLPISLICQVCQVTSTGYSVKLTNTNLDNDVDLASQLVMAGFAEKVLEEKVVKIDLCETSMDLDGDIPTNMFNLDKIADALDQTDHETIIVESHTSAPTPSATVQVQEPTQLPPLPALPRDMPSLSLVRDLTEYKVVVPRISWWQTSSVIHLAVQVDTVRDVEPGQVHVKVTENMLVVQVVEHFMGSTVLHTLPVDHFLLWGMTVPSMTNVQVKARLVTIQLRKQEELSDWLGLGQDRFDWIKRDLQCLGSESTVSRGNVQNKTDRGQVLHSLTKESVLQEELFDILDEEEEESSTHEEDDE